MSRPSRVPAVIVYLIPFLGWLYVYVFQRQNSLAVYHLRQSVGLFLFLVISLVAWAVVAWLLAWIPLMAVLGVGLFTLVIAAYLYGAIAWILGLLNALRGKTVPLPGFGRWASRLPIR